MIYLDHNATSPMRPEVREAMAPWMGRPANPASQHRAGQAAAMAVDLAREQVAALFGRDPAGVVFTSGATEANHLWVWGAFAQGARRMAHSAVEHPCVRGAHEAVAERGAQVLVLPVDRAGRAQLGRLRAVDTLSLMAANHETGVLQPVVEAQAWCEAHGARLHVDATQAAGRIALPLGAAHAVVWSSHKIGGPGGMGVLSLRHGEAFPPMLRGGAQERGRRSGTVNVAGAVGFGAACQAAARELDAQRARWASLQRRLERGLLNLGGRLVGGQAPRLPQTTNVVFAGLRAETLAMALDLRGFCVSAGSACASGSVEASPVLRAMGEPEPHGGLRISMGPDTSEAQVEALVAALPEVLAGARAAALFA